MSGIARKMKRRNVRYEAGQRRQQEWHLTHARINVWTAIKSIIIGGTVTAVLVAMFTFWGWMLGSVAY